MGEQANYISFDDAKNIIMTALEQFSPELSERAANVLFSDQERLNIREVTEGDVRTGMMACRPAGITIAHLEAMGMHIPEDKFKEAYGPYFTEQENLKDFAIIDFEYDGSARAIVWLAHELGHAMADDLQREKDFSFRDFSLGAMEEQAYFVQHIVSKYIKENLPAHDVSDDALGQSVLKMTWERATQYTNAGMTFDKAQAVPAAERTDFALKALNQRLEFGEGEDPHIPIFAYHFP